MHTSTTPHPAFVRSPPSQLALTLRLTAISVGLSLLATVVTITVRRLRTHHVTPQVPAA